MSLFEPKEPQLNFFEKAHLRRRFHFFPDVTVTYDTGSMFDFFCYSIYPQMRLDFNWILLGYGVENGAIVGRTTVPGISTTLNVVSSNGYQFNVTRERGGGINNHVYNVFIFHGESCRRSWERRVNISSVVFTLIVAYFSSQFTILTASGLE